MYYNLSESELTNRGIIDSLEMLNNQYDVARVKWGKNWRLPNIAEIQELESLKTVWTTLNGVYGRLVIGNNGNKLFLPVTGYYKDSEIDDADVGFYLSSTEFWTGFKVSSEEKRAVWSVSTSFYGCVARPVYSPFDKKDEDCSEYFVDNNILESGHRYVDLGLPSGTLWAICNVGAKKPEDLGDYFAFAETSTKTNFDYDVYKHKWGSCPDFSQKGVVDEYYNVKPTYDVATRNWGTDWRMPTYNEAKELTSLKNKWVMKNGVYGCLFICNNGNMLFLPASGDRIGDRSSDGGRKYTYTKYRTAYYSWYSCYNYVLSVCSYHEAKLSGDNYCFGQPVRAVRKNK